MEKNITSQNYHLYTNEDHKTWEILSERQTRLRNGMVSKEYLAGFDQLQLDPCRIVSIDEMSVRLKAISGWTLIPVGGLIPTRDFFYMLINRKYPITVPIRKPHEIDFSEQPDIFHDVYGHLPLLTNEKFVKFLTAYSAIALKYINNDNAVDHLGRLYWFTYEMGIIREDGVLKPYGGAIITSAEEIANAEDPVIPKYDFDIDHVFRTPYNSFKLQKEYFVIESFDDLFYCLAKLEPALAAHLQPAGRDLVADEAQAAAITATKE